MTETQQKFIVTLFAVNGTLEQLFGSGDITLFSELNHEIKTMYDLQHGSEDPVMKACNAECEIIYQNFDMIIAVLRTTEDGVIDGGAQSALNKLLHNIDEAVVNLATALGIVQ